MGNNNVGLVITGDDDPNKLTAYAEYIVQGSIDHFDVYNVVHGAGGDDTLNVNPFYLLADTGVELYGEDGNDTLSDSKGNDTLSGGSADDVIHHSGGNDQIDGGDGVDDLYLAGSLGKSTVTNVENLFLSSNTSLNALDLSRFDQVTSLVRSGMTCYLTFQKQTTLSGVDFEVKHKSSSFGLFGSGFGDHLDVSDSTVKFKLIDGRNGDDILTAGHAGTELSGAGGYDTLNGGDGNDTLSGGGDDDFLSGGGGNDRLGRQAAMRPFMAETATTTSPAAAYMPATRRFWTAAAAMTFSRAGTRTIARMSPFPVETASTRSR